jgi:hypothetical protein
MILLYDVDWQMGFLAIQEVHFPDFILSPFQYFSNYFQFGLQPYSKINHFIVIHFLFEHLN